MPGLEGPIQIQLPFSMADIQQCKEKLGRYSEDPDKVSDGFQTPALAFNLSWKDIQFLWVNCCTPIFIGKQMRPLPKNLEITNQGLILSLKMSLTGTTTLQEGYEGELTW
jgi:hypothetical protein